MHTTKLRKVGGSVMLALPPAVLDLLRLGPGAQVGLSIEGDRLFVEPKVRPQYTLEELISLCHPEAEPDPEDFDWLEIGPAGKELL